MKVAEIDFSQLGQRPEQEKLYEASAEYGFFALVNHGIEPELQAQFTEQMAWYFDLPLTLKLQNERTEANPFGFYNKELTKNQLDLKEVFDISLSEDTMWPPNESFKHVTRAWFTSCHRLAMQLLDHLFSALGLETPTAAFTNHSSFLRLNYYARYEGDATNQFGVSHHTDAGALTLLLQDKIESLQFKHDDAWHTAPASPDHLFVNLGDMLQVWSNDTFTAPLHRVLTNRSSDRYSAPYFLNPSYDSHIKPLTGSPSYREISWQEFRSGRAAGDYADLGEEIQIQHYRL